MTPGQLRMTDPARQARALALALVAGLAPVGTADAQEPARTLVPGPLTDPVFLVIPYPGPDPSRSAAFTTDTVMIAPLATAGRSDAMINGALIALGALGIFDNVVIHWILGWHRAIEDSPYALHLEIGIVAASTAMLVTGVVRERRARRP
jgi:uncharacterized membrane protein